MNINIQLLFFFLGGGKAQIWRQLLTSLMHIVKRLLLTTVFVNLLEQI